MRNPLLHFSAAVIIGALLWVVIVYAFVSAFGWWSP